MYRLTHAPPAGVSESPSSKLTRRTGTSVGGKQEFIGKKDIIVGTIALIGATGQPLA